MELSKFYENSFFQFFAGNSETFLVAKLTLFSYFIVFVCFFLFKSETFSNIICCEFFVFFDRAVVKCCPLRERLLATFLLSISSWRARGTRGQPGEGYPGHSGYDSNRCPTWLLLASVFFAFFSRFGGRGVCACPSSTGGTSL